jgi:hypothetical protein
MFALASSSYFQIAVGAVLSLAGSFWANYWFHGRVEKRRAEREAKRAYNNLMNRRVAHLCGFGKGENSCGVRRGFHLCLSQLTRACKEKLCR